MSLLVSLVRHVVQVEGPVHADEVARRVATAFDRQNAGRRILAAASSALGAARRADQDLHEDDEGFWSTTAQAADPPVRDRSGESGATFRAAALSMAEIRAALRIVGDDNPGGEDADLIRAAARLMGFRRVGPDLQARIAAGLR